MNHFEQDSDSTPLDRDHLGPNLRELRLAYGLTQSEAAKHFHVVTDTISKWETNKRLPNIETLIKIAEFYHINMEDLVKDHSCDDFFSNLQARQNDSPDPGSTSGNLKQILHNVSKWKYLRIGLWTFFVCLVAGSALLLLVQHHRKNSEIQVSVFDEQEFEEVLSFVEAYAKDPEIEDFPEGTIYTGYKLYTMDPGVFSCMITKNIPLNLMVLDHSGGSDLPYVWILRIGYSGYCTVERIKEKWRIRDYSLDSIYDNSSAPPAADEWAVGLINQEKVQMILDEKERDGEQLTGEQLVFTTGMTNTTFFAFRTKQETYLITFPWRPGLTGLASGACYTAKEVKEILDKTCPVIYAGETVDADSAGGGSSASLYERAFLENAETWPPEYHPIKGWLITFAAALLCALYITLTCYFRDRQRADP